MVHDYWCMLYTYSFWCSPLYVRFKITMGFFLVNKDYL